MTAVIAPPGLTPGMGLEDSTVDDVPITINRAVTRADKLFRFALGTSSVIVLAILAAVVVFLSAYGWRALRAGGLHFFTDSTWSPDSGHFGAMPLLVGSVAIAVVGVLIAGPVSLASALMINEYAPSWARSFLTRRGGHAGHRSEHRLRVLGFVLRLQPAGRSGQVAGHPLRIRSVSPDTHTGRVRTVNLRLRTDLRGNTRSDHHLSE